MGTTYVRDEFTSGSLPGGAGERTCTHAGELNLSAVTGVTLDNNALKFGLGAAASVLCRGYEGGALKNMAFAAGLCLIGKFYINPKTLALHFGFADHGTPTSPAGGHYGFCLTWNAQQSGQESEWDIYDDDGLVIELHDLAGFMDMGSIVETGTPEIPINICLYVRRLVSTDRECECWIQAPFIGGAQPGGPHWFCVWKGLVPNVGDGLVSGIFKVLEENIGGTPTLRMDQFWFGLDIFDPAVLSKWRCVQGVTSPTDRGMVTSGYTRSASGTRWVALQNGVSEGHADNDIELYKSVDAKAAVWDKDSTPFASDAHYSYVNANILGSGDTLIVYTVEKDTLELDLDIIVAKVSSDDGANWSAAFTIFDAYDAVVARPGLRLSNGLWVIPFHLTTEEFLIASSSAAVPDEAGDWGCVQSTLTSLYEPTICQRTDGTLLMIARDPDSDYAQYATCADPADLETWSGLLEADGKSGRPFIPNGGDPLQVIHAYGREFLFTNGPNSTTRNTIEVMVSDDAGATFNYHRNSPIQWVRDLAHYPSFIRRGKALEGVHTTYQTCNLLIDPDFFAMYRPLPRRMV